MGQQFNGPVDQVAGGNINNYGGATWGQRSTEDLNYCRKRYRSLLWAARRRLIFNLPNLVLAITVPGLAAYALFMLTQMGLSGRGSNDDQLPPWAMFGFILLGLGLPLHLSLRIRGREGAIIFDCNVNLRAIDIVLNQRKKR
jgi:hypothetical protein